MSVLMEYYNFMELWEFKHVYDIVSLNDMQDIFQHNIVDGIHTISECVWTTLNLYLRLFTLS